MLGEHAADHRLAAAVGHVHVDEHDVGERARRSSRSRRRPPTPRRPRRRRSPSSARTPLRNRWWSSTRNTRTAAACRSRWRIRVIDSSTSVPWPGRERMTAVPPWRCMRPVIDSRDAAAVGRRPIAGSKPRPRSRTNTVDLVGFDLVVDRDHRRARVPRRVDHRLAGREHERAAAGRRARTSPPTRTALDRDALRAARRRRRRASSRVAEIEVGAAPVPGRTASARSSRSCRRARPTTARGSSARRWIMREGLQHRVVQVRGHLGALVGADALAALLHERVSTAARATARR